uniref:Solute carrier family 10 member 1 n=1 Tax=Varanus komodoensis TaxID=61221 RepID=A0A8D2IQH2_VARKO
MVSHYYVGFLSFSVPPVRQRHNVKFQSVVIVVLFLVMASLGCTMEISKTKDHFWKHKGVAIAVAAQYGIMPPIAFALGKAFQLDPTEALAALICDCCPGGNLSNILSLASKGDMNLSVGLCSMATCLPPPHFYFQAGMIILLLSSVPIIALTVIHVGSRALLITFAPRLLATSALMPFIGFSLGYALEIFFNFSDPLETVFNFSDRLYAKMCSTILKIAFPPGVIGSLFLFPSMHLMFHLVEGLLRQAALSKFLPCAQEKDYQKDNTISSNNFSVVHIYNAVNPPPLFSPSFPEVTYLPQLLASMISKSPGQAIYRSVATINRS